MDRDPRQLGSGVHRSAELNDNSNSKNNTSAPDFGHEERKHLDEEEIVVEVAEIYEIRKVDKPTDEEAAYYRQQAIKEKKAKQKRKHIRTNTHLVEGTQPINQLLTPSPGNQRERDDDSMKHSEFAGLSAIGANQTKHYDGISEIHHELNILRGENQHFEPPPSDYASMVSHMVNNLDQKEKFIKERNAKLKARQNEVVSNVMELTLQQPDKTKPAAKKKTRE